MEKFSKKTLLNYVNGAGLFGAAPSGSSVVKFAWASTLSKIGTGGDGTITFYADTTNGSGLVLVGDQVVSSKIMDLAWAQSTASGAKTGEKVVTLKYISGLGENAQLNTVTLDVIDKVAAKAIIEDYFATSNTIDVSNGVANVRVDGETILIDANDGLKSGLNIAYIPESGTTGATIALRDKSNTVLSSIDVSYIVGDGVLKDSIYHQDTNILELRFGNGKDYNPNDPTTYTKVEVNLQKLIDINDVFIGNDSSIYLNATLDASTVTLDTKMQDPSTADATHTGLADAWKVKQYVDSKSSDLGVTASGDAYVDASVDSEDNKHINVAATDKTKTAVALAETAVQSVVEGTSTEGYVVLNVSAKSDASVVTITTNDSALSAKITEIDASIDRLDASVSAIETAIAGMDADLSVNTLDGSIGITLSETDGKVTAIGVTATKATVTFDNTGDEPSLTSTSGLLVGDAIAPIKNYIDTIAEQGFDGLDSQIVESDTSSYVTVTTGIVDGKLLDASSAVAVQYADLTVAPGTVTVNTDGIATGTDVKSAVEGALTWTVLS